MICYWKPEDGMESGLHLFFDDTAESHLHIDSLFTLGTGIVRMIGKILLKHTDGKAFWRKNERKRRCRQSGQRLCLLISPTSLYSD